MPKHKHIRGIDFIKTLKNHFFKYVLIPENDDDCMEWQGYVNPSGYGKLMHDFKSLRAHRISYMIFVGEIPRDKEVCHTCDNTKCINPNHLFLGTHKENMIDMCKKKRHLFAIQKGSEKPQSKLKEYEVSIIRKLLIDGYKKKQIARIFNVNDKVIHDIHINKIWRHVK